MEGRGRPLRLSVVKGGGIAGLVTRTELAGEDLSAPEAEELRERVSSSGLLGLESPPAQGAAHPDEQRYELTVDDDDGAHTVRLREGDLPPRVRSLVEWADGHPRRRQRVERG